jgi:hypothetical protein
MFCGRASGSLAGASTQDSFGARYDKRIGAEKRDPELCHNRRANGETVAAGRFTNFSAPLIRMLKEIGWPLVDKTK